MWLHSLVSEVTVKFVELIHWLMQHNYAYFLSGESKIPGGLLPLESAGMSIICSNLQGLYR
jgi:hypothetical protein